jgi:hypothetical protein
MLYFCPVILTPHFTLFSVKHPFLSLWDSDLSLAVPLFYYLLKTKNTITSFSFFYPLSTWLLLLLLLHFFFCPSPPFHQVTTPLLFLLSTTLHTNNLLFSSDLSSFHISNTWSIYLLSFSLQCQQKGSFLLTWCLFNYDV